MRLLRYVGVTFVLTGALVTYQAFSERVAAESCCTNFIIFCQGYCQTRGGVAGTVCAPELFELCQCGNGEWYHGEPHYCTLIGG